MKTFKTIFNSKATVLMLLLVFALVASYNPVFGEEPKKDGPNNATKSVFAEVKKDLKADESLGSFLMIAGVIGVVGLAMYLSFRPSGKKEIRRQAPAPHNPHHGHAHPAGTHGRRR